MPHDDLVGRPTPRELELACGLSAGELHVWIIVCMDEQYPFVEHIGEFGTFSWYQKVKKPYGHAMTDVYAVPMCAELTMENFEDWEANWIGDYVYGVRSGRLVVCLSEPKELHSRIQYWGKIWAQELEDIDVAGMGFCPECARLCPGGRFGGEDFEPECHRLIGGRCPACGWA